MKKLNSWSLKSRLTWSFMMVVLCISLVISWLYYSSQRKLNENSLVETDKNDVSYLNANLEKQLRLCEQLSDWVYVNRNIETALVRDYEQNMKQYSREIPPIQRLIVDQLKSSSVGKYVTFLYIKGNNNVVFRANTDADWVYDLPSVPWHSQGLLAGGRVKWLGIQENPAQYKSTPMIIPIVRPVIFSDTRAVIGWHVLAFSPELISDVFQDYHMDDGRGILVIDENDRAVFHYDPSMIGQRVAYDFLKTMREGEGRQFVSLDGKRMLVTYKYSDHSGMTILLLHSLTALEEQTKFTLFILILIFAVTAAMFFILTYYLSNRLTKPLGSILDRLKEISEGNFEIDHFISGNDEMGLIGRGINDMAYSIGSLMNELIEREHEKCELEYRVLLNQINPHFVYNALNSIKVMADIQKIKGISEMASSLGTLLKEISKGSEEQIPIKRELELLESYLHLQRIRKCGLLSVQYDIPDESVLSYLIPRFTLQPLAENAIYHGLDLVARMGIIFLSIKAVQDDVVIVLRDNGAGIERDKIPTLLDERDPQEDKMTHVGLPNVEKRIKLIYGRGGLKIQSSVGEFTSVTLRFPKTASPSNY